MYEIFEPQISFDKNNILTLHFASTVLPILRLYRMTPQIVVFQATNLIHDVHTRYGTGANVAVHASLYSL